MVAQRAEAQAQAQAQARAQAQAERPLDRALRLDGHTRAWYAQKLGLRSWQLYRLLEGQRLWEYERAQACARLLHARLDDLFEPVPVKESRRWYLRFAAKGANPQEAKAGERGVA